LHGYKACGLGYFSEKDLPEIQIMLRIAAEFAGILDQSVFESDGSVKEG